MIRQIGSALIVAVLAISTVGAGGEIYGSLETTDGTTRFQTGDAFSIGTLRVSTRLTCGHSPGGTSFVIHGLGKPVAIVGDAIFAASMGGGVVSYRDASRRIAVKSSASRTRRCCARATDR